MTEKEINTLLRRIKRAIKWHNANANFDKVQALKAARGKLKLKLRIFRTAPKLSP